MLVSILVVPQVLSGGAGRRGHKLRLARCARFSMIGESERELVRKASNHGAQHQAALATRSEHQFSRWPLHLCNWPACRREVLGVSGHCSSRCTQFGNTGSWYGEPATWNGPKPRGRPVSTNNAKLKTTADAWVENHQGVPLPRRSA